MDQHLADARAAFAAHEWGDAWQAFKTAEEEGAELTPDELEQLGYAAMLNGELDLAGLERSFAAFEAAGRVHDAARVGCDLVRGHFARRRVPIAKGWARRIGRILETADPGLGHAYFGVLRSFLAQDQGKVEEALALVERAHAIAREHEDRDAEALTLNRRGRVLIRLGRVEEAKADLDEAMALLHCDQVSAFPGTTVYCSTIDACRDMADYERALQWTDAAQPWITKRRVMAYPAVCRMHRAELLRLRGEWGPARAEIEAALEDFERWSFGIPTGYAHEERGLQALARGDLDAAESAFEAASEWGVEAVPGLPIVHLRRGDASRARTMLEVALREHETDPLGRANMLPAFVEAAVELGDVGAASEAVEELERTAEVFGTVGLRARASTARARLHLAEQNGHAAVAAARRATREWSSVGAMFEFARGRELLAKAYSLAGDEARASIEVDAAHRALDSMREGATLAPSDAATMAAPGDSPLPPKLADDGRIHEGTVIGEKIEVGPLLGAGAMGLVFSGRHRITGRDVAIKVLQGSLCHDDAQCQRFLQEALACGRIRSPNVVDVYDAGEHQGQFYIVMERLHGESLGDRISRQPAPSLGEALEIGVQIARGLADAHASAVIHRDLKPDNVFLCDSGTSVPVVKLVDFGISKLVGEDKTRAGALMGTPFYMSPEQVRDSTAVDERSDVHALGAVLFEMLTGHPPYRGNGFTGVLVAIAEGPAPDLAAERPDLPPEVVGVVSRALAREPAQRWTNANALADALSEAARS